MKYSGRFIPSTGFSLIELLVVTAILGIVIAAIAGSLAGGINVWDAAQDFNKGEAEAALALAEIEQDLVNAFDFFDLSFAGREDRVAFPCVVEDADSESRAVGHITYSIDDGEGGLLRTVEPYPRGQERTEVLVNRVEEFKLTYYNLVKEKGVGHVWQDAGVLVTGFPARVDIQLAFMSESGAGEVTRSVLLQTRIRR